MHGHTDCVKAVADHLTRHGHFHRFAKPRDGIGMGGESKSRLRAVTHLDVDKAGVKQAAKVLSGIIFTQ